MFKKKSFRRYRFSTRKYLHNKNKNSFKDNGHNLAQHLNLLSVRPRLPKAQKTSQT